MLMRIIYYLSHLSVQDMMIRLFVRGIHRIPVIDTMEILCNALGFAKRNAKKYISITSFNEWHEGTNIEAAAAGQIRHDSFGKAYQDYGSHGEYYYLDLTRLMLINVH